MLAETGKQETPKATWAGVALELKLVCFSAYFCKESSCCTDVYRHDDATQLQIKAEKLLPESAFSWLLGSGHCGRGWIQVMDQHPQMQQLAALDIMNT